jgi:hypothetical protein
MMTILTLMQDDSVAGNTWDVRVESPLAMHAKVYVIFLLVVCIVAAVKLARTWWGALPFLYLRRALRPTYLAELRARKTSLGQWMGITMLGWAVVTAIDLARAFEEMRIANTGNGRVRFIFLYALAEDSTLLVCAMTIVLVLYLVRWNVMRRMERLEVR